MRTKALFLAAVLGVAMVATSVAQVYSVNAVGYVNLTVAPGLSMIANPLQAPINDVSHVLTVPDGTQLYKFNGAGFDILLFDVDTWVINGVPAGTTTLNPGEGAFIKNNTATPFTNTFVGDVVQGTAATGNPVTVTLPAAGNVGIVASKVPIAGKLSTDLKYPQVDGTQAYIFNGAGYDVYLFDVDTWTPSEPTIQIAQSFWVRTPQGSSGNWVRDFTVN